MKKRYFLILLLIGITVYGCSQESDRRSEKDCEEKFLLGSALVGNHPDALNLLIVDFLQCIEKVRPNC
ncbi:hypothetical protein EHQ05_17115 [Leptospira yasudae]|uniref:hypothetical protein n=1 Tax=Leptospira yasudae TaxID=2202201 RepID=UPI001082C5C1|nr:hypothetical protein [Leptospira yasudae]TGK24627.1 hypothetical protein EHQ05_17115 [Leptospira yasudae]TGM07153.1 hypothetical protein EHQ86_07160 [Leptospira yasudae]